MKGTLYFSPDLRRVVVDADRPFDPALTDSLKRFMDDSDDARVLVVSSSQFRVVVLDEPDRDSTLDGVFVHQAVR